MRHKNAKWLIVCFATFSVLVYCRPAASWLKEDYDFTCAVQGELAAEHRKEIFEHILNENMLHSYFHFEVPERQLLIVLDNECLKDVEALNVRGGKVELRSPKEEPTIEEYKVGAIDSPGNYLYFKDVTLADNQVTVSFDYPIEGVAGGAVLEQMEGRWKIISFSAPEY